MNNCKSKLLFKFCFSVWNQAYINLSKLQVTSTRIHMHFYQRESCKYMYDYHWFTLVKTGCHLFLKTCKTPSWHQLTPSLPQRRGSTIVKRWGSRINSKERIYNKFKGDDLQQIQRKWFTIYSRGRIYKLPVFKGEDLQFIQKRGSTIH